MQRNPGYSDHVIPGQVDRIADKLNKGCRLFWLAKYYELLFM